MGFGEEKVCRNGSLLLGRIALELAPSSSFPCVKLGLSLFGAAKEKNIKFVVSTMHYKQKQ
jgi:hypothetical protein